MSKITKHTGQSQGPRATVAKLEDARCLLTKIRQALDQEILERANDQNQPKVGWRHFGDASRLLEELKEVGHLLLVDRNEVLEEHACPECRTCNVNRLQIDEGERVICTVCDCEYTLD